MVDFKRNNFDLIRLLAAAQVAIWHFSQYSEFGFNNPLMLKLLSYFPGVPIFFFISGLLISRSFENNSNCTVYFKNRALRIFPALIVCVAINLLAIFINGYFSTVNATFGDVVALFFAKVTFLQFYNPDFMRDFGDGVLNGSLWTICVELQFYLVIPFIYLVFINKVRSKLALILVFMLLFFLANRFFAYSYSFAGNETWWKLMRVSFLPWFYFFIIGMLVQMYFNNLMHLIIKIPTSAYLVVYLIGCILYDRSGAMIGNNLPPLLVIPLILFLISFAYNQRIRPNVLRGHDFSYGIYIWHMPILNQFIYNNYYESYTHLSLVTALTLFFAYFSWFLIERPAISLKKYSLRLT